MVYPCCPQNCNKMACKCAANQVSCSQTVDERGINDILISLQNQISHALAATPAQGPTGLSAYESAVKHAGFIGTELEWLASLKGAPGLNFTEITVSGYRQLTPAEQISRLWIIMPDSQ